MLKLPHRTNFIKKYCNLTFQIRLFCFFSGGFFRKGLKQHVHIIIIILLTSANLFSQIISNVRFKVQKDESIIITYYLNIPDEVNNLDVEIYATTNGSNYLPINSVTGDVGVISESGRKKITWNVFKDVESFSGDRCGFKITAEETTTPDEIIAAVFIGSNNTKKYTNGLLFSGGWHDVKFLNSNYKESINSGMINTDEPGYIFAMKIVTLPFLFDISYLTKKFKINTTQSVESDFSQSGLNISASLAVLPLIKYLIPYVGVGYQFSSIHNPLDKSNSETTIAANISAPYYLGAVFLYLGNWFFSGEYKKSFSKNQNRDWEQFSVSVGFNFKFARKKEEKKKGGAVKK